MITPILQLSFLCAHDMSVPVESLSTAITAIATSLSDESFVMNEKLIYFTNDPIKGFMSSKLLRDFSWNVKKQNEIKNLDAQKPTTFVLTNTKLWLWKPTANLIDEVFSVCRPQG